MARVQAWTQLTGRVLRPPTEEIGPGAAVGEATVGEATVDEVAAGEVAAGDAAADDTAPDGLERGGPRGALVSTLTFCLVSVRPHSGSGITSVRN
jgi:hypothetical protein